MAKRLIVCSDGTWNTPDQQNGGKSCPSNVVKLARAVAPTGADGTPQIVFYDQGVGTNWGLDRLTGGAFGRGIEKNIQDAYRFLMQNYEAGDEIFLFGFSRGAYTVRSTAGLIRKIGLLRKRYANEFPHAYAIYRRRDASADTQQAEQFRADHSRTGIEITCVGVWDTVGALGVPVRGLRALTRRKHEFHDVRLSASVRNAFHALAIDEQRAPFYPTFWRSADGEPSAGQRVEQVWFAGVHTNVGGGYPCAGLSDHAFKWMVDQAASCGLSFDRAYLEATIRPDVRGTLYDSRSGFYRLSRGRPRAIGDRRTHPDGWPINERVHESALERAEIDDLSPRYQPANLRSYLEQLVEA